MAPIVAPCLQVSVRGTVFGHNWANVFHVQELGATPPDPTTAAQAVLDAYCNEINPIQGTGTNVVDAQYADLSSLSGISGTVTPTVGGNDGGGSGSMTPSNCALLVTWSALGSRSQRNGRSYIVGLDEDAVDAASLLTSGYRATWQTAIDDFVDALQAADLGLVVLSKTGPSAGTVRTVLSGAVEPLVATQRRRLRR